MANTPYMPWTDFNNSIVMGSFVCGLLLLAPVHFTSRPFFEKYSERLATYARQWKYTRLILGAEWANRIAAVD
jgi:hypothetical protein